MGHKYNQAVVIPHKTIIQYRRWMLPSETSVWHVIVSKNLMFATGTWKLERTFLLGLSAGLRGSAPRYFSFSGGASVDIKSNMFTYVNDYFADQFRERKTHANIIVGF